MKTIGIKLADGSFYPILQENTPSEKALELTTAHNNQTKIMVDLYRSSTCTMDDAEYVDSLQIENLVAHPNGEPDISFTVSIDENNQLSAKIVDPETGNQSNTTITLVSRTVEERLVTDEYNINELNPSDDTTIIEENFSEPEADIESEPEESNSSTVKKAALAGGGLLAAASLIAANKKDNEDTAVEEDSIIDEPMQTFDETAVEEQIIEETTSEEVPVDAETPEETQTEKIPVDEGFSFGSSDTFDDTPTEDSPATAEEDFSLGSPDTFDDTPTEDSPAATEDFSFDLPDDPVSTTTDETLADETIAEETVSDETIISDSFDDPVVEENADSFDGDGSEIIIDDEIADENVPDSEMDMDFSMPDISSEIDSPVADTQDDFFNMDDTNIDSGENMNFNDDQPAGNGISFTGLYDKETELGEPAGSSEVEEVVKKKTKVPVIICIICAIICLLATALVLFVIPSKYNLITKNTENKTVVEETQILPETKTEPAIEEPVIEAKEEEVIVIEKAEEVVPEQPPVAEEKPADITYKIKWGDTLWDIADTYYKNPWRYKYIARFNGIKNPDYIISGTYITIPAE